MEIGVQIIYILKKKNNNGNAIFISTLASGPMFKVRNVFLTKESIAFSKRLGACLVFYLKLTFSHFK